MNGWPKITVQIGETAIRFRAPMLPSERFALVQWYMLALAEARGLLAADDADAEAQIQRTTRAMLLIEGATGFVLGTLHAEMEGLDGFYRWRQQDPEFNGPDGRYLCGRSVLGEFCDRYGVAFEHAAQIVSALVAKIQEKREPASAEVEEVRAFFGHQPESTT